MTPADGTPIPLARPFFVSGAWGADDRLRAGAPITKRVQGDCAAVGNSTNAVARLATDSNDSLFGRLFHRCIYEAALEIKPFLKAVVVNKAPTAVCTPQLWWIDDEAVLRWDALVDRLHCCGSSRAGSQSTAATC